MKSPSHVQRKYAVLPFLLFGSVFSAFADAGVTQHNYCYWYLKKYVTNTKGKNCGAVRKETADDRGCNWAESWLEYYPCGLGPYRKGEAVPFSSAGGGSYFTTVIGVTRARIDGNRATTYSWGGVGSYGYRIGNEIRCTNGGTMCMGSDADKLTFPTTVPALVPTEAEPERSFRSAFADAAEREYDPATRTMTVKNFHATLRNNPYDQVNEFSALTLSLLRSSSNIQDSVNQNNEDAYREHVLAQSRVLLRNGKLTIDGILQKATVITRDSAGVQIADITMPAVSLEVPLGIEPEDFAFHMSTDVGNLAEGIAGRYLPGDKSTTYEVAASSTSPEVLELSSYPNPATHGPVTVEAMVARSQQVVIGLYDQYGMLMLSIYSGTLPSHSRRSFPVNLQKLAPGTYYLRLERNNSRLTRRVIIR